MELKVESPVGTRQGGPSVNGMGYEVEVSPWGPHQQGPGTWVLCDPDGV